MLAHALAKQARRPTGLLGRLFGMGMGRINGGVNDRVISQLEIAPEHSVLEIGFGPGRAVQQVERMLTSGRLHGIDMSSTMVDQATRLNRRAIQLGKVKLQRGEASHLPYRNESFQRIFCVNVIYFWSTPERELAEMFRVAQAEARVAIYVGDRDQMSAVPMTRTGVFRLYSPGEIMDLLRAQGFHALEAYEIAVARGPISKGACVVGTRPRDT